MSLKSRVLAGVVVGLLSVAGRASAEDLSGKVLDAGGLAVPNAKIRLLDRNGGEQRNTTSAADGTYRFTNIPAGDYVIEADASDSALIASQRVSVAGNQTQDLKLKIAGAQSEVLVTASSAPQTLTEVAKAVDVVTADQIDKRDVFQVTEALRLLPGIQITQLEGPGSFTTIKTRGTRYFDTAVLIDGMRFQDSGSPQNDATSFLEDLTTTDTDRIEFLRGSGSSLYGSSAMAGVVNIVSRTGGGPTQGDVRIEGGGLGMVRTVAGIGGGAAANKVFYSGTLSYLNIADGVRDLSPYDNTSGQGSVRVALRPHMTLSGRFWGANATLTSGQSPTFTPEILANSAPGTVKAIALPTDQLEKFEQGQSFDPGNATYIPSQLGDPDANRLSSFFTGVATFQHTLSANSSYRVAYQGVTTRRGYRNGPEGSGFQPDALETSHNNGRTDTVQARGDWRAGSMNSVTAGYEFVHEKYIAFGDTATDDTHTDLITTAQQSHAFYGQDQIQLIGGKLQVSVSARMQFFTLSQPFFANTSSNPYANSVDSIETPNAYTGDVAAAYFVPGSQTKLRLHTGNSYRAPSSFERFGSFGFDTYYGDPRLEPEHSVSVDGGIDQWLMDSKVQVSASLFWTDFSETIRFAGTPADDPFGRSSGYTNGGGGDAKGVELSAHLAPTKQTQAQISYTHVMSESDTPTFGTDYHKILGLSPNLFSFSITQGITARLRATFDLFSQEGYDLQIFGASGRLFQFDSITKANLVVGYGIPLRGRRQAELYMKVENLFDQQPYEQGFIGADRWVVGGARIRY